MTYAVIEFGRGAVDILRSSGALLINNAVKKIFSDLGGYVACNTTDPFRFLFEIKDSNQIYNKIMCGHVDGILPLQRPQSERVSLVYPFGVNSQRILDMCQYNVPTYFAKINKDVSRHDYLDYTIMASRSLLLQLDDKITKIVRPIMQGNTSKRVIMLKVSKALHEAGLEEYL